MFTKEERLFIWKMEETNMADIIIVEGKYEIQRSVAPYDISCNVRR